MIIRTSVLLIAGLVAACAGGDNAGEPGCLPGETMGTCVDGAELAQCPGEGDTSYTPAPCGTRRWVTVNCFEVDGERRCSAAGCFSRPIAMAACATDGTVTCEDGNDARCACGTPPPSMQDCVSEGGRCVERALTMTESNIECEF